MSEATAAPTAGAHLSSEVARSTAAMSALTVVSRITGVVRIAVAASVLGATFLGNTYQSANTVPNLLFELFVAGSLQAALIPTLVELLDGGERQKAVHVARSVLGLASVGLAVVAVAGMAGAPFLMRAVMSGVRPASLQDAEVRLGTFLLWFFLPQVVFYAAGLVATSVLNAQGRFSLPAFAPVVNNVVVIASYGLFWKLRAGAPPSLDLTLQQKLVLGGGTTLAVASFCAVPVAAAVRSGFSLRPRLDARHPAVRQVARRGAWAAVYVAMTHLLLPVVLVLANRIEGGVIAYQVAFTFFLLPHALFALPVTTALYPRLARSAAGTDLTAFGGDVASGVAAIAFFLLLATAGFLALSPALASVALFGGAARSGAGQVASALVGFAPGVLAYGAFLFLTRAFYALGDVRTPALVNAGVGLTGAAAMIVAFSSVPLRDGLLAIALAHSAAHLGGAIALFGLLRRRLPRRQLRAAARPLATSLAAAGLALLVMRAVAAAMAGVPAAAQLAAGGFAGALVYLAAHRMAGTPIPVASLRRNRDGE